MLLRKLLTHKYALTLSGISVMVAFLTHFPELIALSDEGALFPGMKTADVVSEVAFTFISLLLLLGMNIRLFRFDQPMVHIGWKQLLTAFALTWAASNLLGKGFVMMHHTLHIPAIDAMLHHYLHPLRDFLISCIVTGSCYLMHLDKKSRAILIENQQLRTENLLNQYEALKSQLNPHMLFNSLNTLYSLIREKPDKAQNYLQQLASVLRYTLRDNENHSVTLQDEMGFVQAYIYLMKMRYEDNLIFHIQLPEEFMQRKLPPMAVQILIENAVKHNEASNRKPLQIVVTAHDDYLEVSNPIQPKRTTAESTRLGLDNLGKRYRLLMKKDIEVEAHNGYFCVRLPLT